MWSSTSAGEPLRELGWEGRYCPWVGDGSGGDEAVFASAPGAAALSPPPCSLVQANPEVAMDCVMQMAQHITSTQKAQLARLLSTADNDGPS